MKMKNKIFTLIVTMVYMLSITHSLYHHHTDHNIHEGCQHDITAEHTHTHSHTHIHAFECKCQLNHNPEGEMHCCNANLEYVAPTNKIDISVEEISLQSFYDVVGIVALFVVDSENSHTELSSRDSVEPVVCPYLLLSQSPNSPPFSC